MEQLKKFENVIDSFLNQRFMENHWELFAPKNYENLIMQLKIKMSVTDNDLITSSYSININHNFHTLHGSYDNEEFPEPLLIVVLPAPLPGKSTYYMLLFRHECDSILNWLIKNKNSEEVQNYIKSVLAKVKQLLKIVDSRLQQFPAKPPYYMPDADGSVDFTAEVHSVFYHLNIILIDLYFQIIESCYQIIKASDDTYLLSEHEILHYLPPNINRESIIKASCISRSFAIARSANFELNRAHKYLHQLWRESNLDPHNEHIKLAMVALEDRLVLNHFFPQDNLTPSRSFWVNKSFIHSIKDKITNELRDCSPEDCIEYIDDHIDRIASKVLKDSHIKYPKLKSIPRKILTWLDQQRDLQLVIIGSAEKPSQINSFNTQRSDRAKDSTISFETKLLATNPNKFDKVFHELKKDGRFIASDSKLNVFKNLFSGEKVVQKIEWTGYKKNEFRLFISLLGEKLGWKKKWEIAENCFSHKDGDKFFKNIRHAGIPKESKALIEKIVDYLNI